MKVYPFNPRAGLGPHSVQFDWVTGATPLSHGHEIAHVERECAALPSLDCWRERFVIGCALDTAYYEIVFFLPDAPQRCPSWHAGRRLGRDVRLYLILSQRWP